MAKGLNKEQLKQLKDNLQQQDCDEMENLFSQSNDELREEIFKAFLKQNVFRRSRVDRLTYLLAVYILKNQ